MLSEGLDANTVIHVLGVRAFGTQLLCEQVIGRVLRRQSYFVTAPNQVSSWDITWLKTDIQGLFKYAYNIIDLYDRSIVGWTVEDNESDEYAYRVFTRIIRDLNVVPKIVHADNGYPMRGVSLAAFLDKLMISRSYSRPRCSNDNSFVEAFHKTLKYTAGYP